MLRSHFAFQFTELGIDVPENAHKRQSPLFLTYSKERISTRQPLSLTFLT